MNKLVISTMAQLPKYALRPGVTPLEVCPALQVSACPSPPWYRKDSGIRHRKTRESPTALGLGLGVKDKLENPI